MHTLKTKKQKKTNKYLQRPWPYESKLFRLSIRVHSILDNNYDRAFSPHADY